MVKLIKLFCIVVLCNVVYAVQIDRKLVNKYLKELDNLTSNQKSVLLQAYNHTEDIGILLATIAWKESRFGDWLVNSTDGKYGSYGIYHINLEYHIARKNITSKWARDRELEKLMLDSNYSTLEASKIVLYWQNRYKNNNYKTYLSYNAGYDLTNKRGIEYAKDALHREQAIREYMYKYLAVN